MPKMMLYGDIGDEIIAASVIQELQEFGDVDEIVVGVNSRGGSVLHAHAIYNAFKQHPANIVFEIDAMAASAMSYIVLSGNEVRIHENAQMMVHCASLELIYFENCNDPRIDAVFMPELKEIQSAMRRVDNQIANMYAARTGHKPDTWKGMMTKTTYFSAEEAIKKGLADKMIPNKSKRGIAAQERPTKEALRRPGYSVHDLAAVAREINREIPEPAAETVERPVLTVRRDEKFVDIGEPTTVAEVAPVAEAKPEVNIDEYLASLQARAAEVQA